MTDMVLERVAAPISTTRNWRLRFTRLAPAALGLLIAIGGMKYGYDWWRVGRFIETTDDAYAGGNITPVSPHAAGFISEILVADNQRVAADQLLIRIDPRDFRAALNHARAFADERQASLASLEAKYVLQQQMVTQAEADLAAKTAKASFATTDAIRAFAGHPTSGAIGFACVSRSARVPVILEDRRRGGWPKSALQPGKL